MTRCVDVMFGLLESCIKLVGSNPVALSNSFEVVLFVNVSIYSPIKG